MPKRFLWYAPLILLPKKDSFDNGKRWWRGDWSREESPAEDALKKQEKIVQKEGRVISCARVICVEETKKPGT